MILALDNIRSAYNVGSLIRTAEAFGVKEIVLGGITPGISDKKVLKTSLGAENGLKITEVSDLFEYLKKQEGFEVISLEITKKAENIKDIKIEKPFILVVGNEVSGVNPRILEISNRVVKIPMMGKKESLNVSVASGIAIYELSKF